MFKIIRQARVDDDGREYLEVSVARRPVDGKNWPCRFFKFNRASVIRNLHVAKDDRVGMSEDDFVLMYRVGDSYEDVGLCFTLGN